MQVIKNDLELHTLLPYSLPEYMYEYFPYTLPEYTSIRHLGEFANNSSTMVIELYCPVASITSWNSITWIVILYL